LSEERTTTEQPEDDLPEAFALNGDGLPGKVFLLRQKLYRKAKREPKFRFTSCTIGFVGRTCCGRPGTGWPETVEHPGWME